MSVYPLTVYKNRPESHENGGRDCLRPPVWIYGFSQLDTNADETKYVPNILRLIPCMFACIGRTDVLYFVYLKFDSRFLPEKVAGLQGRFSNLVYVCKTSNYSKILSGDSLGRCLLAGPIAPNLGRVKLYGGCRKLTRQGSRITGAENTFSL